LLQKAVFGLRISDLKATRRGTFGIELFAPREAVYGVWGLTFRYTFAIDAFEM
jgi:hypothetical protein